MEFKELPHSIQKIAAHALRQRLTEVALESATKKDSGCIGLFGILSSIEVTG